MSRVHLHKRKARLAFFLSFEAHFFKSLTKLTKIFVNHSFKSFLLSMCFFFFFFERCVIEKQ